MAAPTMAMRNVLATAYGGAATHGTVYTTSPTSAAPGTEPTGGSPAFARKPLTWSAPSNGSIVATGTFDIPPSTTVVAVGLHSAASGGTYYHGVDVTSQPFVSQATYAVTYTFTVS